METTLKNKWFLLMTNSIIALIAGIIFLLVPGETLATIGFATGIIILLSGLFLVFGAFSYAKKNKNMFFWLLEGLINLTLGIILIINPIWLAQFIMIIIGLWALVLGIYQLYVGVAEKHSVRNSRLLVINGLATSVIGLVILLKPDMVASFVIQILGVISIILGGIMMYFAFMIKRFEKEIIKEAQRQAEIKIEAEDAEVVE